MDSTILMAIVGVVCAIVGIILGKFIFAKNTEKQIQAAELEGQKILAEKKLEADAYKKEREIEAKERFIQLKSDHEKEIIQSNRKIADAESRIRQKEQSINSKEGNLEKQLKEYETLKDSLNRQLEVVSIKRSELEKHQEEHIRRLEKVAGLTAEEAKSNL